MVITCRQAGLQEAAERCTNAPGPNGKTPRNAESCVKKLRDLPLSGGISPLKDKNMLGSNPLIVRFLLRRSGICSIEWRDSPGQHPKMECHELLCSSKQSTSVRSNVKQW